MTIEKFRDLLVEARRYARVKPDVAVRYAHEAADYLEGRWPHCEDVARLAGNLRAGARYVLVAPDVLAGYCDGAHLEVGGIARKDKGGR